MTNHTAPRRLCLMGAGILLMATSSLVWAQSDKPLRLIVPLTTGSTVDTVARSLSNPLAQASGHPVVVENLPGAGGMTGTAQMVRAPKDGLTLALTSSNHVINPGIYKKPLFDALKDITPITVVGTVPLVLVVSPSVPAKNAQELIALLKARKGEMNIGSAGNGSVLHLAAELFASEAGVDITHVPYKGTGPLVTDLLGGQVQAGFVSVTAAAPHIKAGKLRAIGTSTKQRSAVLPDVPTLAESGLPNYAFDAWLAVIGPADLPKATVDKLFQDVKKAVSSTEVQQAFAAQGIATIVSTPEQTVGFFKAELDKHLALVKKSGATAD
ncbi:Bug family tripartite tricarboxylate transporter substrate binding protein [Hydrogenophaga sp. OTU3427]|uniref:Bug family tripartite tricarboxylate transporter substrate binding protein n=1 Tax=Hydrogenophaga sp. OTU3427 TaxID=3043856 RepID=UPI00313EA929